MKNMLFLFFFICVSALTPGINRTCRAQDNPAFYEIVEAGNQDLILEAINNGADVNAKDPEIGFTPLLRAVMKQDTNTVRLLLEHGADIEARSDKGDFSALYWAARSGNLDMVKLLLDHGADVEAGNRTGESALFAAVSEGRLEIIRLLLQNGANVNHKANATGEFATPLHTAVLLSQPESAELLIENGADLEAQSSRGTTALHIAVSSDQIKLARLLLDHGADINACCHTGNTPIHFAVCNGYPDMVTLLTQYGADLQIKNKEGLLPRNMLRGKLLTKFPDYLKITFILAFSS